VVLRKVLAWLGITLLATIAVISVLAQGNRGKAQLDVQSGTVTVDYGRPSLNGRDMLSELMVGDYWRMGTNEVTVITVSADAYFGGTKVPKGSYSLWLLKRGVDNYVLVFNSQTGQWGTEHDPSKDLYKVSLMKEEASSPVETFTIELKPVPPKGGILQMSWGNAKLTTTFRM